MGSMGTHCSFFSYNIATVHNPVLKFALLRVACLVLNISSLHLSYLTYFYLVILLSFMFPVFSFAFKPLLKIGPSSGNINIKAFIIICWKISTHTSSENIVSEDNFRPTWEPKDCPALLVHIKLEKADICLTLAEAPSLDSTVTSKSRSRLTCGCGTRRHLCTWMTAA